MVGGPINPRPRPGFRDGAARWTVAVRLLVGAIVAFTVSLSFAAQAARSNEAELKAAFLYNFIKFTEWPAEEMANKKDPFVIGVLGKDPLGAALDRTVENETFQQRPIVVRRFTRIDETVAAPHALFIANSEEPNLAAILKLLEGQPILTVSEAQNFVERGGMIELTREGSKLAFEINVSVARRAGLNLSAQLLRLAKLVKQ